MLRIGTSGWQYADWAPQLYAGVPRRRWLEHYWTAFATVELNASFYRLPAAATVSGWQQRTPADCRFAVKASRYLSHVKRLREPEEPVARLVGVAARLGDRLGPVLLQLPPDLQADAAALDRCLAAFPAGWRVAVEPRHPSWWSEQVRAVLVRRGAALVWADRGEQAVTPLWRTCDWGYLRFHEGCATWPAYRRRTLGRWAREVAGSFDAEQEVYAYFNNDPTGAAVRDAVAFARLARRSGLQPSRVPGETAPR